MAANTTCNAGEVVCPHNGFRAVPCNTKLQRRYLHRLKYGDPEVVGFVPKGVSLPVEAANARFRFVPDQTIDRTSGVTELVKVEGEYKPMDGVSSSPTSDLCGYAAIDRAARVASFRLRVVSATELRLSSFFSNAAFIEKHGWRDSPEDWLLTSHEDLSNGAPAGLDELQAAIPDDVDAPLLALHLAWLGKIVFAYDERVSRHSRLAVNTVDKGANDLASVLSLLRSAA